MVMGGFEDCVCTFDCPDPPCITPEEKATGKYAPDFEDCNGTCVCKGHPPQCGMLYITVYIILSHLPTV